MGNSSQVSYFTLAAYFDVGPLRWLYFLLIMLLYALIVLSNLLLIVVICLNRTLHEPMYIFLCSLFVNELWGSTALFPFLLFQILQDVHIVPQSFCFLQIFLIHSYGSIEFTNLAVMSYDRYLSICFPLQYNSYMTPLRVATITAVLWLYSIAAILVTVSLSLPLKLCGNVISKVYCDNYSIVKLACGDTTVNNIYGVAYMFFVVAVLIVLIVFSYVRILRVCFGAGGRCKRMRQKALNTCTPHLVSLLSFSFGAFFEILQSRFDMSRMPMIARILLSLYFLSVQPLLNPLLYGLKLGKIRNVCQNLLLGNRS